MLILPTPRNTCIFKITGTDTLRLASKALFGFGTNLQNISDDLRSLYVPDGWDGIWDNLLLEKMWDYQRRRDVSIFSEEQRSKGKMFVQVDQSGAEALIVAYLCRHGKFRELFLNKIKPHIFVALHVFTSEFAAKYPEKAALLDLAVKTDITKLNTLVGFKELKEIIASSDKWSAQERYYYIAKMICHASNYGMRGGTFQLQVLEKSEGKIVLSRKQADGYLSGYHGLFDEIMEWHAEVWNVLDKDKVLYNLQGFPREFTGRIHPDMLKDALAFIPQSTVGTITNVAFTNLQEYIETHSLAWDLLNNCHDSYLCQCPIGEEVECGRVMRLFMEQELTNFRGEKFRMRSEAQAGFNWAKGGKAPYLEDGSYGNFEGLQEIAFPA